MIPPAPARRRRATRSTRRAERVDELHADNRELHFSRDEETEPRDHRGPRPRRQRDQDDPAVEGAATSCPARRSRRMAGLTLSGLASGLDTESIVSQLMAIEQNKVTAVQQRQIGRPAAQGRPQGRSRPSSTRSRRAAAGAQRRRDLEADADRRRRRTRPGSTSTLLGGAGIGGHSIQVDQLASSAQHGFTLHAERHRRHAHALLRRRRRRPATARSRSTSPPTRPPADVADAINANEGSPVVRRGRQGRRRRAPRPLLAQDRRELRLHRRHVRLGAGVS